MKLTTKFSLMSVALLLCTIMLSGAESKPASGSVGVTPGELTLWYTAPADKWMTQALPIGNGFFGGMIFGGIDQERVQVNKREYFCSNPDGVMVIRFTADNPGAYSPTISFKSAQAPDVTTEGATLTCKGKLKNGLSYETQCRVLHEGGELSATSLNKKEDGYA